MRTFLKAVLVCLVVSMPVFAATAAPEIDIGSAGAGATVIGAAALMISEKFRKPRS